MKAGRTPKSLRRLEERFWITTAVITFVVLALTVLDAYYFGFR